MKYQWCYDSPIGHVIIETDDTAVTRLFFGQDTVIEETYTPLIAEVVGQLEEYFRGERQKFDFPITPFGTAFQCSVWAALCEIPYGETRSYKDIAKVIGRAKACRAVGMANNKNPIGIVIPCHRVIASDGSLCGYAGGVAIKQALLELEKNAVNGLSLAAAK